MSGGTYDYAFSRVISFIEDCLVPESEPSRTLRVRFKEHLELVAKAMNDIELVDSGDCEQGSELESIRKVLGIQ